jgi:hypothetical protein
MFTINHQEPPKSEGLWQVEWVHCNFERMEVTFGPASSNGSQKITSGLVYVMNENGKTVAKYDLSYNKGKIK